MEEANFKRKDSSVYTGVSFCNHLSTVTKDKKSHAHERHKKKENRKKNPKPKVRKQQYDLTWKMEIKLKN